MTTEFIPLPDDDPSRKFEHRIGEVINSVIAFAYGTREDESPNVIGTGFSVGSVDEDGKKVGVFATCLHVMKEIKKLKNCDDRTLKRIGIIDRKKYIAYKKGNKFDCIEVGPYTFVSEITSDINPGKNFAEMHDICFCRIPDVHLPSLPLSTEYFIGSELGILGFPLFENLQKITVQPYAIKTILSCYTKYPLEQEDGTFNISERLAMGCILGEGFSGSPVFSIRDGKVIGMVDYVPPEVSLSDIKLTKLALLVEDYTRDKKIKRLALLIEDDTGEQKIIEPTILAEDDTGDRKIKKTPPLTEDNTGDIKISWEGTVCVQYPAGISFGVPSKLIINYLEPILKGKWVDENLQKYTKQK